jgi:hypothetical protein
VPRDGEDTLVHVAVGELGEEGRGHVEGAVGAAGALVGDVGLGGVAVLLVGDGEPLAAVGAVLGGVLGRVESDDEVAVRVGPAAGAEADGEVGGLASVGDALLHLLDGGGDDGRSGGNEGDEDLEHCAGVVAVKRVWGVKDWCSVVRCGVVCVFWDGKPHNCRSSERSLYVYSSPTTRSLPVDSKPRQHINDF